MKINQKLCPKGLTNNPNKPLGGIRYVTIHNIGVFSKGSTAKANAEYLLNNSYGSKASWHYSVDAEEIWQSFLDEQACWHAGDGSAGPGNSTSIGIEICHNWGILAPGVTASGANGGLAAWDQATPAQRAAAIMQFSMACKNAAWLVAGLLTKHQLPIDRVVQHNKWSGKDCPFVLRHHPTGISWEAFVQMVQNVLDESKENKEPDPVAPLPTNAYQVGQTVEYSTYYLAPTDVSGFAWQGGSAISAPAGTQGTIVAIVAGTQKYQIRKGVYLNDGDIRKVINHTTRQATVLTGLYLRSAPNALSKQLAVMPEGAVVEVLESSGTWWKLKYKDLMGYANSKYLKA